MGYFYFLHQNYINQIKYIASQIIHFSLQYQNT